jgi:isopentenyl-diphosphate delta-isomerase
MLQEHVILVDENDNEIGVEEKLSAHLSGKMHRAVSVFIFNKKDELLLQQRAFSKYHCGGMWSNTCCGHPRPGESPLEAAERRLLEEMGIRCQLKKIFNFTYKADVGKGLTEHEFDHVFMGEYDGPITPNPEEANDWKWAGMETLQKDLETHPQAYTVWFKLILEHTAVI